MLLDVMGPWEQKKKKTHENEKTTFLKKKKQKQKQKNKMTYVTRKTLKLNSLTHDICIFLYFFSFF